MLTFEQFQATRHWEDDLSGWLKMDNDESDETLQGYLYGVEGDLWIAYLGGVYWLQIANDEQTSVNLEELERKLYDYGCRNGHCDEGQQ